MPTLPDPRDLGDKPPFARQDEIKPPGLTSEMKPAPDHGEDSYQGHNLLEGFTTIITGGDSGIGRAVAIAFAREGADVVLSYLPEEEADAFDVEKLITAAGRKALLLPGDLTSEAYCEDIITRTMEKFGKIDVLVNNAAYQSTHSDAREIPTNEFDRAFRTNVYATFFLCRAAFRHMQPGANIINTTSIQGFDPTGMLLHYAATKGALNNMTRTLAEMGIEHGIRVNAVAPGPVWTPLIPSTIPKAQAKVFGEQSLFKRPAQPREMAPIYVFLASHLASYVTGEVYGATGGRMPV